MPARSGHRVVLGAQAGAGVPDTARAALGVARVANTEARRGHAGAFGISARAGETPLRSMMCREDDTPIGWSLSPYFPP